MKIKIIDLLVKIANGEEVPKKIKYEDIVFDYTKRNREGLIYIADEYSNYEDNDNSLIAHLFWHIEKLNDEVEIIEEPKKIEKIEIREDEDGHYFLNNRYNKIYIRCDETDFMIDKFNELTYEINNLKENKHE